MKRALVVVAKRPMAGETKTRLCPPLEPDQASELYRCFLLDTLDLMAGLGGVRLMIAYTPPSAQGYFRQMAPEDFALIAQEGENLGQRLSNVVDACMNMGYAQVVVMNSDGPTLPAARLQQAFELLDCPKVDVVLGPSDDGGYYLIGLKRTFPALFQVTMSTPTVLRETLRCADELGLQAKCLPGWYDIDMPSDLQRLVRELPSLPYQVAVRTRQFLACWPGLGRYPESWSASPPVKGRRMDSA